MGNYTSLTAQRFTAAVVDCFHAIVAMHVLAMITSPELHRWISMLALMQLHHVYLVSTVEIMHGMKFTRPSSLLSRVSLEMRIFRVIF